MVRLPAGHYGPHGAAAGEALRCLQRRERHHDGGVLRHLHFLGPDHGRHPGDPLHRREPVLRLRHVRPGHRPEGPVREGGAHLCGHRRGPGLRGHAASAGQLAGPLRVPGQYRHDDPPQPGHQLLHGRDILHHQGPVRRAAAGGHHGLLHLPLEQLQRAARPPRGEGGGHGRRRPGHPRLGDRVLHHHHCRLHRPVFHDLHHGPRFRHRHG